MSGKNKKVISINANNIQNLAFVTTEAIIKNAGDRQTVLDIINSEKEITTKIALIQNERDELLKRGNKNSK